MTRYVVQPAKTSTCPKCRQHPRLLRAETGITTKQLPAFYICACGFIGQIGVGPVEDSTD